MPDAEALPTGNAATLIVIPARLCSRRLPHKALADIGGMPMVAHVARAALAARPGAVVVACDDERIAEAARGAGARAVLTDPSLASGSDRVQAALRQLDGEGRYGVVVNLQGDMPDFDPRHIALLVAALGHDTDVATLVAPIASEEEAANPQVVKAAVSWRGGGVGAALYFSRTRLAASDGRCYHHIGAYAFRRPALERFAAAPPSPLERYEKLEQLRILEAGMRMAARRVARAPLGVDTVEDLARARRLFASGVRGS